MDGRDVDRDRWPLVLRFWKGSIHGAILFPVFLHVVEAACVVYVNQHINSDFNLPSSIVSANLLLQSAFRKPLYVDATEDSLALDRCRSHASVPQPNSLLQILGRSGSSWDCDHSHTMPLPTNLGSRPRSFIVRAALRCIKRLIPPRRQQGRIERPRDVRQDHDCWRCSTL